MKQNIYNTYKEKKMKNERNKVKKKKKKKKKIVPPPPHKKKSIVPHIFFFPSINYEKEKQRKKERVKFEVILKTRKQTSRTKTIKLKENGVSW